MKLLIAFIGAALITVSLAACGTQGPISNGGVSASAVAAKQVGVVSSNKKAVTGSIMRFDPNSIMAFKHKRGMIASGVGGPK